MIRLRLSEDRASVTTSIDSYPFSPSSPWAQALPSRSAENTVLVTTAHVSHSRYNRYGYPVFPQKPFGLPSPTGKQKQQTVENTSNNETPNLYFQARSRSLVSPLPRRS